MGLCLGVVQGKNVLRKEPMSKEIGESDTFIFNAGFHSKFYKVKIGTVSAQKETEPEKQETRQKVIYITLQLVRSAIFIDALIPQ